MTDTCRDDGEGSFWPSEYGQFFSKLLCMFKVLLLL